jgi:hypothetical protein
MTTPVQFAADPLASHSAQFPLGRLAGAAGAAERPSSPELRPWGLRGMRIAKHQGDPVREVFFYSHEEQVAVDAEGRYLMVEAATANKVTNCDGDEGPSEDFTYDFCPDSI